MIMFTLLSLLFVNGFYTPCNAQFFPFNNNPFNQPQPQMYPNQPMSGFNQPNNQPFNNFPNFGGFPGFGFPPMNSQPQQVESYNNFPQQQNNFQMQPNYPQSNPFFNTFQNNNDFFFPNQQISGNRQPPIFTPPPTQSPTFTPPPTQSSTFRPNTRATTIRPINQQTSSEIPHRATGSRISETKCNEYLKAVKDQKVAFGSLGIDASHQDIDVNSCHSSTGLVVGGVDATKGEFPHMAALGYREGLEGRIAYKCGGSLISERFVLTAAHCKTARGVAASTVRLGDLNLKVRETDLPELDVPISQFISHESYDPSTKHNDIAVVRMDRDIQLQKRLRPACLAQPNDAMKVRATATGWGSTAIGGTPSDILQKVVLKVYPYNQCKDIFKEESSFNLIDKQICAGDLDGGKDTCGGDSGGPLQTISDTNQCKHIIIGVTSYGSRYCGTGQPGIYTKVSDYIDWIERKVWGS